MFFGLEAKWYRTNFDIFCATIDDSVQNPRQINDDWFSTAHQLNLFEISSLLKTRTFYNLGGNVFK